jgi:hypothetical protein
VKNLLVLLFTLLAVSTAQAQGAGKLVEGPGYKGVIFPAELKLQAQDTARRWTPTAADIEQLERDLAGFMAKQPSKSPVNWTSQGPSIQQQLRGYTRQYAGYFSPKGEKMIYVNCFWNADDDPFLKDWPSYVIEVNDGGSAFWHIHYNASRRKFRGLGINGVG